MANRREWQLISIFDKDRRAAITTPPKAGSVRCNGIK